MAGADYCMPELRVAIALCRNSFYDDRSKHIDVRYHYIRECVEGDIVVYTATAKQVADLMTNALGWIRYQEMRGKIEG
jgi:hypothetical protein